MINPNLASVNLFLQRTELLSVKKKMQIRSTELQAVMSSTDKVIQSGKLEEIKFQFKSNILRELSASEKIRIYTLLRVLSIENDSEENWFSLCLLDLQEFYMKIGLKQNLKYFYYTNLADNQFAYELDCKLWSTKERTNFFRELFNPIILHQEGKVLNSFEVLELLIQNFRIHFIFKNKPRKKVYRKGYNDHGSLGSEFAKTLRQQSTDWSLNEREENQKKERSDLLQLLLGFNGWLSE